MTDIVNSTKRSKIMSGIRSSNTKPEVLTRKALHRLGYRFRLDTKVGKIKPDIVLPSRHVAVFVHGCYWHQHHGCKLAYSDRNYSEKWQKKFEDNRSRDIRVVDTLMKSGWRVAVIWECATRKKDVFTDVMNALHQWIQTGGTKYFESDFTHT